MREGSRPKTSRNREIFGRTLDRPTANLKNIRYRGVVCAVLPFFAGIMWIFTPLIRFNEQRYFAKQTEASSYLIQSVNGIETIKAMAVERQVRWKLESLYIDTLLAARRAAHTSTAYSGLATLVQTTSAVLFLWYGAHEVLADAMSPGQLLAFVTIAGSVVTPIFGLVSAWDQVQNARNAVDRLGDVFESEVEQTSDDTLITPDRVEGHICFENVSFSYRGDRDSPTLGPLDL